MSCVPIFSEGVIYEPHRLCAAHPHAHLLTLPVPPSAAAQGDGERIAFASDRDGNEEIYVLLGLLGNEVRGHR